MGEVGLSFLRMILTLMLLGGMHEYAPPSWGAYGAFIAFLGLSFLVTLIHELSHALAVWLQRGTVIEISVLGLTYSPQFHRFNVKSLPPGGDLAGYVNFLPPEEDWTRRQYGIVIAAGPAADAALALLALATSMWQAAPDPSMRAPVAVVAYDDASPTPAKVRSNLPSNEEHERIVAEVRDRKRWEPLEDLDALAPMLMVIAFISSLGNLLPYRGSDGAKLLELWRGRNRFARMPKRR
ncbi:site-2 protease family protein [Sphingopyxis sp. KK2]|uniref:site-2 protease family protein n=1 Tax=Sphingopyxis sp. KK2 TaxID=1855727 RepID=UPI00097E7473|nr:site-2 protease family protein [Sphingopyxis sp. KK2]